MRSAAGALNPKPCPPPLSPTLQGLVEHVKREKSAMAECESPFIVRLKGTSQDDKHIYMMMEAVMGGELFGYLQVGGGL